MASGDGSRETQNHDDVLTYNEIKEMVRGFLCNPSLLKDAQVVGLTPTHFLGGSKEAPFIYLYAAAVGLHQRHGAVNEVALVTQLRAWYDNNSIPTMRAEELEELIVFIADSFQSPALENLAKRAERQYQETILRRFVNVRILKYELQHTVNSAKDTVVVDFEERLQQFAKKAKAIQYLGREIVNAAHAPEFGAEITLAPPPEPTTIPWIDQYLGGFRKGDIIGILGPFEGGKTTMMASAAVRMAQQFFVRGENKLSIYICYEDGAEKMNSLFWSAASHIDRNLFVQNARFWEHFSTRDTLKPYERELPENRNGEIMLCERDRWSAMLEWFNRHFLFLDFSKNIETGNHGDGGVAEVVSVIEKVTADRNMDAGAVFVDYTGIMVERELANDKRGRYMENLSRPIKNVPDDLRTHVAVPFGATVMLAHQLAGGDIKNKPAYKYTSHLDAAGSKSFAENVHACLCINTRDQETKVSTIHYSKIRAYVPVSRRGLIRMDDNIVDIHLVNEEYTASDTARKILRRGDVAPVAASAVNEPRRRIIPMDRFAEDNGLV